MSYKNKYKNRIMIKKARTMADYIKFIISFLIIMTVITICSYWFLFKYHQKTLLAQYGACMAEVAELKDLNAKLFKEKTVLEQRLQLKEDESLAIKNDLLKSYQDKSSLEKKIQLYKKVIKNS